MVPSRPAPVFAAIQSSRRSVEITELSSPHLRSSVAAYSFIEQQCQYTVHDHMRDLFSSEVMPARERSRYRRKRKSKDRAHPKKTTSQFVTPTMRILDEIERSVTSHVQSPSSPVSEPGLNDDGQHSNRLFTATYLKALSLRYSVLEVQRCQPHRSFTQINFRDSKSTLRKQDQLAPHPQSPLFITSVTHDLIIDDWHGSVFDEIEPYHQKTCGLLPIYEMLNRCLRGER